jgi:hypothetical protein
MAVSMAVVSTPMARTEGECKCSVLGVIGWSDEGIGENASEDATKSSNTGSLVIMVYIVRRL